VRTDQTVDPRRRALDVIQEQLSEATAAHKCHGCGCLHQTVAALEATDVARGALAPALAEARRVFISKRYDCLGCDVCYPAIAANAFTEAYPGAGDVMELCPTEAPELRDGWPPLPGDYHVVRYGAPVAVCTLNDEGLAARLADAAPVGLAIAGTMRTENLGIERVIKNTLANAHIRCLLLCGDDTRQAIGHLPGQSMQSLFASGIDSAGRIRGARGKRPLLKNVTRAEIDAFLAQIDLVALIGESEIGVLAERVIEYAERAAGPFEGAPVECAVPTVDAVEPERLIPDPAGYLVVYPHPQKRVLLVEHFTNQGVFDCVLEGRTPAALYATIIERGLISRLDHAAYLGRELARAQHSLETGETYAQDRAAGALPGETPEPPTTSCGCAGLCGTGGK